MFFQKKFKVTEHTTGKMIYDFIHNHPNCKFSVKMNSPQYCCGFVFQDNKHSKVCKCHFLPDEIDTHDIFRQMKKNDDVTDPEYKDIKYLYKVRFGTGKKYWDKTMYWNDFCSMVVKGFIKFC